jgi:hypothetical protein
MTVSSAGVARVLSCFTQQHCYACVLGCAFCLAVVQEEVSVTGCVALQLADRLIVLGHLFCATAISSTAAAAMATCFACQHVERLDSSIILEGQHSEGVVSSKLHASFYFQWPYCYNSSTNQPLSNIQRRLCLTFLAKVHCTD